MLRFFTILLVVAVVVGSGHYYIWARLVRDPGLPDPWRRGLTALVILLAIGLPAGVLASRSLAHGAGRAVIAVLLTWMGTAVLLIGALAAADLVRWAAGAVMWAGAAMGRVPEAPLDPIRRLFVARAVAGGAALAAGAATAFAVRSAVGEPRVHEVPIRLERLPPALSGLTLAQISDLHVGPTIGEKDVARVVELTNAMRPDVVAITGDLVDGGVAALRHATRHLAQLRARYGVYFVTGNHEYYSGAGPWMAELRRYGIRVLENETVTIGDTGPRGASLDLAGIPDWSARPDLSQALAGRDPDRSLVLLAHQPRRAAVEEAVKAGVELQVSGHTHGGQIFPWSLLVGAVFPYLHGLYDHREANGRGQVFVSCGTGYWGPPLRLGAPAEVAKLVLVA